MTKKLLEMDQKGELSGDAAYIFRKSKAIEELYDLETDPHEVKNLAGDPAYKAKLQELRKALSGWQLEVGDKGFIPEQDLIEMMWPGMVQPETGNVQFEISGIQSMKKYTMSDDEFYTKIEEILSDFF